VSDIWKVQTHERDSISGSFTPEEVANAPNHMELGISQGLVSIFTGVYTPRQTSSQNLVMRFLPILHAPIQNSGMWRRALVVAIPKPDKPLGNSTVLPFKILERLIYTCVEPIFVQLHLQEQASFRHGMLTADQVTLLKKDIKDGFLAKKKAGAMFVDLTAAYDIVCQAARHMVCMIMQLIGTCNYRWAFQNNIQFQNYSRIAKPNPEYKILLFFFVLQITVLQIFIHGSCEI